MLTFQMMRYKFPGWPMRPSTVFLNCRMSEKSIRKAGLEVWIVAAGFLILGNKSTFEAVHKCNAGSV